MLEFLRKRQPDTPIRRVLWWHVLHGLCFLWFWPMYRYRAFGQRNVPDRGPVLFVANHQSLLDPILVGLGAHHRQMYALARSTLFEKPVLKWLIESLNAMPVRRGESDLKAMRRGLDVLDAGHALLIFPEGTRTSDGTTKPFATGMMLLIKRARPTVIPVAIEGAFDVWPRGQKGPDLTGRIHTRYGRPIPPDDLLALDTDAALELLRVRVETMRLELAAGLHRAPRSS